MPGEILTGKGLVLRLLELGDAEAILAMLQDDPSIQQDYIDWVAGVENVKMVRGRIEAFQDKAEPRYAITRESEVMGYIGILCKDSERNEYDIGYFCKAAERGRGHVSDAVSALMGQAEQSLHAKTFTLYINDTNIASQAVARKLGFRQTDEIVDNEVLGCIERRWEREV
jgi:RimJ/RimL family protein N-acetyltransferase